MKEIIKKPFMGLMMGKSHLYYTNIIKTIHQKTDENGEFIWPDVMKSHPEITKSILTRLKCSDWIIISKSIKSKKIWKLHPQALSLIRSYENNIPNKQFIDK